MRFTITNEISGRIRAKYDLGHDGLKLVVSPMS